MALVGGSALGRGRLEGEASVRTSDVDLQGPSVAILRDQNVIGGEVDLRSVCADAEKARLAEPGQAACVAADFA